MRAGKRFTLFISSENINDIIKIIKSLGDSNALIDRITETVKHKIKKQKGQFLPVVLSPLTVSLVQPVKDISESGIKRAGRAYISINIFSSASSFKQGIHWVSLFIDKNRAVYFHSLGTEYIPQEVLNQIRDESITHNMFRTQDNDSNMMCGFYCIVS